MQKIEEKTEGKALIAQASEVRVETFRYRLEHGALDLHTGDQSRAVVERHHDVDPPADADHENPRSRAAPPP